MGWDIDQVERASLWQFNAAWIGYVNANSAPSLSEGLSAEDFQDLAEMIPVGGMH